MSTHSRAPLGVRSGAVKISRVVSPQDDGFLSSSQARTPGSKMLKSSLLESILTIAFIGIVKIGAVCPMSTFKRIGNVVP